MRSIATEDEEVTVEVRDASPGHYLLKIESFSLLSESGIDKFESNEFEAAGHKWKMIIYPDGNTHENGSGHISVYLAISGTTSLPANWEVNAIFTFFLFNQLRDNYLSVRGKMRHFQPIKSIWGLNSFISLGHSNCILKLSLYPKGNANNKGCDISIFLKSVDAKDFDHHEKVKVNGSINLKDQTNGGCKKLPCLAVLHSLVIGEHSARRYVIGEVINAHFVSN
ncbi:ubiquitin C-terminal hydrolase 13-like [Solanum stenotomum]|uniref:ubiquitin C-terminal hydrolase 13-like n=1 Tax=Solanum stenotomum TaxID=172797 RepID=UPI0020D03696|nr:ubiquitin C-terminal hydrolase 13-like [Solanum stenotomum]